MAQNSALLLGNSACTKYYSDSTYTLQLKNSTTRPSPIIHWLYYIKVVLADILEWQLIL